MSPFERLSGLDASFLHLERDGAHMHVGSVLIFEGPAPTYCELVSHIEQRLHLVPRYRQRLEFVPFGQGRPVWVDDNHFNLHYHVRHSALPAPSNEEKLKRLAGHIFSGRLDRAKPLWEIYLVEELTGNRFALIGKTHHCLVDGIAGMDIATVLFDPYPHGNPSADYKEPWSPKPSPSKTQLLSDSLLEHATFPVRALSRARGVVQSPNTLLHKVRDNLSQAGALAMLGMDNPAPATPFNVAIGPYRRFTWITSPLDQFKAVKNALGCTVNDVILAAVAGGLGRWLGARGQPTRGLTLRAMIPVSLRTNTQQGTFGNRVGPAWTPLPVGLSALNTLRTIQANTAQLKTAQGAVSARVISDLADFAPPTIMAQAARLQTKQRLFNLVITNVPGPQTPLYLLGRKLQVLYPQLPLSTNTALGIAVMSYNGTINFGLLGDYDELSDLEDLADDLRDSIATLTWTASQEKGFTAPQQNKFNKSITQTSTSNTKSTLTAASADSNKPAKQRRKKDRDPGINGKAFSSTNNTPKKE